jgi:O-methyltransferase involved in polyketide biosynthesis
MIEVDLGGVPETRRWTPYHRAVEARRPDAVLHDPRAVELVERIDYPFAERFGPGERLGQWQALRARCFDIQVGWFLRRHPDGRWSRSARVSRPSSGAWTTAACAG